MVSGEEEGRREEGEGDQEAPKEHYNKYLASSLDHQVYSGHQIASAMDGPLENPTSHHVSKDVSMAEPRFTQWSEAMLLGTFILITKFVLWPVVDRMPFLVDTL